MARQYRPPRPKPCAPAKAGIATGLLPAMELNPDFDLSAELAARSYRISPVERISLMLSRYRTGRTQAIIENKLLAHQLLRSMGVVDAVAAFTAVFGLAALHCHLSSVGAEELSSVGVETSAHVGATTAAATQPPRALAAAQRARSVR